MKRQIKIITMAYLPIILLLSSCGPGQLLGPTNTPTNTPTPIIDDGRWKGDADGHTITFTIKNKSIVKFTISEITTESCLYIGISEEISELETPAIITEGKFNFTMDSLANEVGESLVSGLTIAKLNIEGMFTTVTTAYGTVSENDDCGKYILNWTAKPE